MQTKPLSRLKTPRTCSLPRELIRSLVVAVCCAATLGVAADPARAVDAGRLYWSSTSQGTIGSAALDGSDVVDRQYDFHSVRPDDVASDGVYLYWIDQRARAIGRSRVDGSGVEPRFLPGLTDDAYGLVVAGGLLYWISPNAGSISRAAVDGSGYTPELVVPGDLLSVRAIAVAGGSLYAVVRDDAGTVQIGKTAADGSGTFNWIVSGLGYANEYGLIVSASHVFWSYNAVSGGVWSDAIGGAKLDGSSVNHALVGGLPYTSSGRGLGLVGGDVCWLGNGSAAQGATIGCAKQDGSDVAMDAIPLGGATSVFGSFAVDAQHFFWTDAIRGIGRVDIDGTGMLPELLSNPVASPDYLAANNGSVLWASDRTGAIGRMPRAEGSPFSLLELPTRGGLMRLGANADGIYWLGSGLPAPEFRGTWVGRAAHDGSAASPELASIGVSWTWDTDGFAVSDSYFFWSHGAGHETQRIYRQGFDDGAATGIVSFPDNDLVGEIAVDAQHVYWIASGDRIGRANVDGTQAARDFITGVSASQIASDGAHLYWLGRDGHVGRANVDGTGVEKEFITGLFDVDGDLAVQPAESSPAPTPTPTPESTPTPTPDPTPAPVAAPTPTSAPSPSPAPTVRATAPPTVAVGGPIRASSFRKGVPLPISGAAPNTKVTITLLVGKKKVGVVTAKTGASGTASPKLKLTAAERKKLKGKKEATLRIAVVDASGNTVTITKTVKLT